MSISRYHHFLNGCTDLKFKTLSSKGLQPKLAVLFNSRLVVYEKKPITFLQNVTAFFNRIVNKLLFSMGLLHTNPERIKYLQESAKKFYLEKSQKLAEGKNKTLMDDITEKENKVAELTEQITALSSTHLGLETKVKELSTIVLETSEKQKQILNNVKAQLTDLKENEEKLQTTLKEHVDLSKGIESLESKKQFLIAEVKDLEPKAKELNQKFNDLNQKVASIKQDREQLKYKEQCQTLQEQIKKLESEKTHAYNDGYGMGKQQGQLDGEMTGFSTGYGAGFAAGQATH